MKVAIDAQLAVGTATGIGEYVNGLIRSLREAGSDIVELAEPRLDPWRFDRRVLWDQVLLPRRTHRSHADVLHCASGTMPLGVTIPIVVTVHDVAWLRVQRHARAYARWYFGRLMLERYRNAAQIVVDSEFSRGELLAQLPGLDAARVHVLYPGVDRDFCAFERRDGDGRTILVVGTVEPRKHLALVIRTLPALKGARILSVGPATPYRDECLALARKLGVADRVEFRGYVARSELLELYANCAVVAMPSRYEGFGYAAAQALCAGVPCVVSDRGSLPEIARGDAPVVPIDDLGAWIDALASALSGSLDRRAAEIRGAAIVRFGWSEGAAKAQSVYAAAQR